MTEHASPASGTDIPFVGREKELKTLQKLLTSDVAPFITVTGMGGCGKSRLAIEAAKREVARFPGGWWFVDLTHVETASGIARMVATALGIPITDGFDPVQRISIALELRKPMLLVLDNFEHLAQHAASTLNRWRQAAPQIAWIITSREPIGMDGERMVELQPLDVPDPYLTSTEDLLKSPAIRMYLAHAERTHGEVDTSDLALRAIADVCQSLRGYPLAIALAASRTDMQVEPETGKFTGEKSPFESSTVINAIAWNYELLESWEQTVFLQSRIFEGGFLAETALEIMKFGQNPGSDRISDTLEELADMQLILRRETSLGPRYDMAGSIRTFAREQAHVVPPNDTELGDRHARWYLAYLEEWDRELMGPNAREALDRIESEIDNALAGEKFLLQHRRIDEAVRLVIACFRTLVARGHLSVARQHLTPYKDKLKSMQPATQARYLDMFARLNMWLNRYTEAGKICDMSVNFARQVGEPTLLGDLLDTQAIVANVLGDIENARKIANESRAILAQTKELDFLSRCLLTESSLLQKLGRFSDAHGRAFSALEAAQSPMNQLRAEMALSQIALADARFGDAVTHSQNSLELAEALDHRAARVRTIYNVAGAYFGIDDLEQAFNYASRARDEARLLGDRQLLSWFLMRTGSIHRRRKENADAVHNYEQARSLFRSPNNGNRLADVCCRLCDLYLEDDKFAEAAGCINEARSIIDPVSDRLPERYLMIRMREVELEKQRDREELAKAILEELTVWAKIHNVELPNASSLHGTDLSILRDLFDRPSE